MYRIIYLDSNRYIRVHLLAHGARECRRQIYECKCNIDRISANYIYICNMFSIYICNIYIDTYTPARAWYA